MKTLTIINKTCELINNNKNVININSISLKDPNTFSLLKKGNTIGCFQLESRGVREYLKKLSPDRFEDLYKAFAFAPDGGKMFSPKKLKCNNESLEIKFMSCPLKKAWQEIGLNNNELCTLLYCASALDEGTMAEAGFNLKIEPWKPGEEGCCRLMITKK